MQHDPSYQNVVTEVCDFLRARVEVCVAAGIQPSRLIIDPGFGFGKTLQHNIALLNGLPELTAIAPVLIGLSRKKMIAQMLGDDEQDRSTGSVVAALRCVELGASIVRVHDVAQTAQAIKIRSALIAEG
jgi:dihydropteroate synthase